MENHTADDSSLQHTQIMAANDNLVDEVLTLCMVHLLIPEIQCHRLLIRLLQKVLMYRVNLYGSPHGAQFIISGELCRPHSSIVVI